jgi:hypothetical protein
MELELEPSIWSSEVVVSSEDSPPDGKRRESKIASPLVRLRKWW